MDVIEITWSSIYFAAVPNLENVKHGMFRGAVLSGLSPESRFRFLPTIPGKMPGKRPKTGIDFFDALLAFKQYMVNSSADWSMPELLPEGVKTHTFTCSTLSGLFQRDQESGVGDD